MRFARRSKALLLAAAAALFVSGAPPAAAKPYEEYWITYAGDITVVDSIVTVKAELGTWKTKTANRLGICGRKAGDDNSNFDFTKLHNKRVTRWGVDVSVSQVLPPGTYEIFGCARNTDDGPWSEEIGQRRTVIVEQPAGWKEVYSTNFDGDKLDDAWQVYGVGGPTVINSRPKTGRWLDSHVRLQDGMVTLVGSQDPAAPGFNVTGAIGMWGLPKQSPNMKVSVVLKMDRDPEGVGAKWTDPETGITTQHSSVAKAPVIWPRNGKAWPQHGEVDFFEDGGGNREHADLTTHWMSDDWKQQTRTQVYHDFSEWHVLGMEITPGAVEYFLDGVSLKKHVDARAPSESMVLVLQTEGVGPADSLLPKGMEVNAYIDAVKVSVMN